MLRVLSLLACVEVVLALREGGFFKIPLDSSGCGTTKVCFMRPNGCHPDRDCTQGYMLSVVGENKLKVEMFGNSIAPAVPLQYFAVAFSHDTRMGDDVVSECVVSESGIEPAEVHLSYNRGHTNDRIEIEEIEHDLVFSDVQAYHVDGRIMCSFVQSIRPQLTRSLGGRLIDLDKEFFLFGATGSAQSDEVNPHDLNRDSFSFPLIYPQMINPAKIGNNSFTHPDSTLINASRPRPAVSPSLPSEVRVSACSLVLSFAPLVALLSRLL